jgi:hypothetical protein
VWLGVRDDFRNSLIAQMVATTIAAVVVDLAKFAHDSGEQTVQAKI